MDGDAFFEALQAIDPRAVRCEVVTDWPNLNEAMARWDEMIEESRKDNRKICSMVA